MKSLTLLILAISSCGVMKDGKYQDDNVVEEIVEEIIENKTGIDLDLTPSSDESLN